MSSKPNIMVSTSVYGFERDIVQICAWLKEWATMYGTRILHVRVIYNEDK